MVCSTAWSDEAKPKLFTCGFDKVILGWNIEPRESQKENENLSNTGITFSCPPSGTNSGGGGPLSGSFFWCDLPLLAVFIIFVLFCHQVVCLIHLVFRQTRELNSRPRTMAQTVSPRRSPLDQGASLQ
jgi:hypothetical protein